jgi:hypothetical protein
VTAGELTINGKRNQHGIEDRFKLVLASRPRPPG